MQFQGKRITVMGLGHFGGGETAARWLAGKGALVTVTDTSDRRVLAKSLAQLNDVPIAKFHLGGHRQEDFRQTDLVVVNPAIRPENRFLQVARDAGTPLSSEIELFLDACPARVIGVTGSNGKSTTAAMLASILKADGRRTWLGGNIGHSLLTNLDAIGPDDWVVLELSSFQLFHLSSTARPAEVALVTGFSPNHLDWHPDLAHYRAAKQRILVDQGPNDLAMLNPLDRELDSWRKLLRGRPILPIPEAEIPPLAVPGAHNRANAVSAASVAAAIGCSIGVIRKSLSSFRTIDHRLEPIASLDGRRFFNDSSSTTPESTIAALRAMDRPVWLLAGGSDKGIDFGPLVQTIAERARGCAFFGTVRDVLHEQLLAERPGFAAFSTESMEDALQWCWQQSNSGDCIVLSPGCSSHDQFQNFRERAETFVKLVSKLAGVDR